VSRLLDRRFNVLAIDQRSGGDNGGWSNRTVEGLGGKQFSYCEAYHDLEAALAYAESHGFEGRKIVWGSSYSAALVVQLAAKNPDQVDGVLAFSPASGGPMADCLAGPYFEDLGVPLLALRPQREMAIESTQRQAEAIRHHGHRLYVADNGVHGSSMLNADIVDGPVDKHWEAVMGFIDKVLGSE
jgi:pimeloyl-ACP methyl ester carboxylesterase